MKSLLIMLIGLLFNIGSDAQKVSISPPLNIKNDNSFEVMAIDDKPLVFRQNSNDFFLNVFDTSLLSFAEKKITVEKKYPDIVATNFNRKNMHIFYSYNHKGDEYLKVINFDGNGEKKDSSELFKSSSNIDSPDFKNAESEDKSKIVLFRSLNSNEMDFIIYDNNILKKIYSKRIKFKDIKTNSEFRKICVTNEGQVYVLFQKIPGLFNKYNNKILIESINPDNREIKKAEINLEFYFDNFRISFDNLNNNLILAGTKNKLFQNKSEGYFTILFNKDLDLQFIKHNQFSNKLLTEFYRSSKVKSYINNLKLKDIILRNDGGIILVLEKVEIITRQANNDFRMRYPSYIESTDNFYGEIILISLHENGDEFWSEMIRKNQISSNDQGMYSSFFILKTAGQLKLIFNDEVKDETQIIMYYINPLGNYGRISLFNTELYGLNLLLRESIQISSDKLLIPSYKNDKLKLVLLDLKNK
jgi:hypothetical protein